MEPNHQMISLTRQCELLDLARSSYYYESEKDESYNQFLMNLIDEQFTQTPFYGVPKMTFWLRRQGQPVNPKRVRRLMRLMGLEAIYPKPRLSKSFPEHRKYPYLLRDMTIDHPDQVWCADITYIRMYHGFIYLVAVMDCRSPWIRHFVCGLWERPFRKLNRKSSTSIRGRNLRQRISSLSLKKEPSRSVWTDGVGFTITSSWKGSGGRSNTKKFIFTITGAFPKLVFAWLPISSFTTGSGFMRP
jgi:hypothetical protein